MHCGVKSSPSRTRSKWTNANCGAIMGCKHFLWISQFPSSTLLRNFAILRRSRDRPFVQLSNHAKRTATISLVSRLSPFHPPSPWDWAISHLLLHLLREKTHSPHAPTPTLKDHGRRFTLCLSLSLVLPRVCSFYAITSLSPSALLFPTIFSCDHPLALSSRSVFPFHSHFISFSLRYLFLAFSLPLRTPSSAHRLTRTSQQLAHPGLRFERPRG